LTLDSIHLELDEGVFATGQAYVALSRCRELSGISLTRPLSHADIKVDAAAVEFYREIRKKEVFS
jgi:ATP-dependent DNA helicase PIF1